MSFPAKNTRFPIHVAVGVIYNARGQILIAKRPDHLHQGGLWEFPGGKVQSGEFVIAALQRELHEELAITIQSTRPLIHIHHDYGDNQVWLDVHEVLSFNGKPHGREGQAIRWIDVADINEYQFPAANQPIVTCLQLPEQYLITGEFKDEHECLQRVNDALHQGVRLIQLRAKQWRNQDYLNLAEKIHHECDKKQAKLILNTSVETFLQSPAQGLQLTSQRLLQYDQRPIPNDKWLLVSVHNAQELEHAKRLRVDAMVIAPVMPTSTHPDVSAMGWDKFESLARQANCPVYALGGLAAEDLLRVRAYGGFGVAAIRAFWGCK